MYDRVRDHVLRVRRQFGLKTVLGAKSFAVKGYISNILAVDCPREEEMHAVFSQVLSQDGCFIDVGVNLGQTLGKVLSIDAGRQYIGFEPQVVPAGLVRRFINDNHLTNCHVLGFGLSNRNGIQKFYSDGPADCMGSLIPDNSKATVSLVPTMVGDHVLSELDIQNICAIKIDVEGTEFEVLSGLRETISKFKPPIIFEVIPNYVDDNRTPVAEDVAARRRESALNIFDLLTDRHGYQIFQIHADSREVAIEAFDLDSPEEFCGTNFIARAR